MVVSESEGPWCLPDGWVWTRLGDVLQPVASIDPKRELQDETFHYIDLSSIEGGQILSPKKVAGKDAPSRARQVVRAGDTLFSCVRVYLKNIALLSGGFSSPIASTAFCVMRPQGAVDARYLNYFVQTQRFVEWMLPLQRGNSPPAVLEGDLKVQSFPVPPLAEQRRIVSHVDALFAEIAEGEAALAEARKGLDIFRRALLKAAVTGELTRDWRAAKPAPETGHDLLARIADKRAANGAAKRRVRRADDVKPLDTAALPELPSEWAWATLRELGEIVGGATVDKKRKPSEPATIPYLRVANVQRGHIDLTEVKTITVERTSAEKLRLLPGDLLLNEGGDRDKIGRGWVWDGSIPNMIHQNHVFRVRLYDNSLNPFFVSHHANEMGRRFFIEEGKQTTNLASISLSKISMLPVPVPPPTESAEIIRRVAESLAAADDALTMLAAEAADAARLKQSILKAAFEGRLVPQDAADEPAGALLARLAADRTEAPAKRKRAKPSTSIALESQ